MMKDWTNKEHLEWINSAYDVMAGFPILRLVDYRDTRLKYEEDDILEAWIVENTLKRFVY